MYVLNSFYQIKVSFFFIEKYIIQILSNSDLIDADNTRQSGDRSIISSSQDKVIKLHEESLLYAYGSIKGQR